MASAGEFEEAKPIEENLVEKKIVFGSNDQPYFIEGELAQEEILAGDNVTIAHSIGPERHRRRSNALRGNPPRKKKK